MRKLMVGAAFLVIFLFLGMANVGCDGASTSWTSPVTPANPVNPVNPVTPVQPSTGMVAFIEDTGGGGASTFNAGSAWKEQAASNPGVNSATRNVYAMNSNGTGLKKLNDQPFDFHSVYMLPDGSKMVFADEYFFVTSPHNFLIRSVTGCLEKCKILSRISSALSFSKKLTGIINKRCALASPVRKTGMG